MQSACVDFAGFALHPNCGHSCMQMDIDKPDKVQQSSNNKFEGWEHTESQCVY